MSAPERVQIGNAELWLGDCREALPLLKSFGCVITDPPCGLGKKMQGGTWASKPEFKGMPAWDNAAPDVEFLLQLVDAARLSVFWGGNYYGLPPTRCWLVWDKKKYLPTMADCELAWTSLDANTKMISIARGMVENSHPTEKPLRLMEWTLKTVRANGVILDPYMGSGTTGVACARMGLQFIGIERERKFFDIACERIRHAQAQGALFPPAPEHESVQEGLL